MPAARNTNTNTKLDFASTGNVKAPPGWTKDQKRLLFNHVIKYGEKDWTVAVPGKTGHQVCLGHRSDVIDQADKISVRSSGSKFEVEMNASRCRG
jgi:hypothetical protein